MTTNIIDILSSVKFDEKSRYIQNIILTSDNSVFEYLLQAGNNYTGQLFFVIEELFKGHIHVIHDCAYANGSCRCRWRRNKILAGKIKGRSRFNRSEFVAGRTKADWENIIQYYVLHKWTQRHEIWIEGELQTISCDAYCRERMRQLVRSGESLEVQGDNDRHDMLGDRSSMERLYRTVPGLLTDQPETEGCLYNERRRRTTSKYEEVLVTIQTLLSTYSPIPCSHIYDLIPQIDRHSAHLMYDPGNQKYIDAAIQQYCDTLTHYSLKEFKELYDSNLYHQPVFHSFTLDPFVTYETLDTSFKVLFDLLNFQFNNDSLQIYEFLTNIVTWFNKEGMYQSRKMNTLCIWGPPSGGKNFFFDCLGAIAQSVGHFGTINKTNLFPFQDCVGRRLLFGNEVNVERSQWDNLKTLCEGNTLNVNVKFKKGQFVHRTPVLMLSNNQPDFFSQDAFKDCRLKIYYWKTCSLLKDYNKKPYPLAIFKLLEHYDVHLY